MYITADPGVAQIAQRAEVDWIFVDLEIHGKEDRQAHLDTVISRHTLEDVEAVRAVVTTSKLLVRINPLHEDSNEEIESVIAAGADIIMLPFFKSADEVGEFLAIVDGRVRTCLLLETPEAVDNLLHIVAHKGIDYVHIGLNDLHLGYKLRFMFEPLVNGTVGYVADVLKQKDIEFGVGGLARLGEGVLPAERILGEHRRLGSTMVILSRSFMSSTVTTSIESLQETFGLEVQKIRDYYTSLSYKTEKFFIENHIATVNTIDKIVDYSRT